MSEAWIAPPATGELPEVVRYRANMVAVRFGRTARVPAVPATAGVLIPVSDLFEVGGPHRLANVPLGAADVQRVISLRELIDARDAHDTRFSIMVADKLGGHAGYQAIQQLPGVGPILGAVFVAEIGEVHRFADPAHRCSWAGLTPRHHESDTVVGRGHITNQGSTLVRWAAVAAIQRHRATSTIALDRTRIASRRGTKIATIAAARTLLTLVYYGLRDGHLRALAPRTAA